MSETQTSVIERPRISGLEMGAELLFVQLLVQDLDFLRCESSHDNSHGGLLRRALEELELKFGNTRTGIPEYKGEGYKAIGMGLVQQTAERISFYGKAGGCYSLRPNVQGIIRIRPFLPKEKKIFVYGDEVKEQQHE